ncbi:MAG: hypothetical protein K6F78_01655 [Bacteroidaceae bacterium]|nr:hypothetical protein [Bacteroidaceae bacterium]
MKAEIMKVWFFCKKAKQNAYRVPKGTHRVGCSWQPAVKTAGYPYLMPKGITLKNELYIYATALSTPFIVASRGKTISLTRAQVFPNWGVKMGLP